MVPEARPTHGRLQALHAELVLETDRKAMQRPDHLPSRLEMLVKLCSTLQSALNEDLRQAICLHLLSVPESGGAAKGAHYLLGHDGSLVERRGDLNGRPRPRREPLEEHVHVRDFCDLELERGQ
jgi:hypothetical protein